MLGHPSKCDFEDMVHVRLIANCPITPNDISIAHTIFGEILAGIHGKTIRQKSEQILIDYILIPQDFVHMHKFITVTACVMFVNDLAFVITFG